MTEAEQIERAHEYLSRVVDEEVKTDSNLRQILRAHMSLIITESMKYKGLGKRFRFSEDEALNKKVNEIISRLREDLYSDIEERSLIVKQIAEEKEDSKVDDAIVVAFLLSKIKGNTLKERINLYAGQLKSEVESFISAGIAAGLSKDEILTGWLTNVKSPYAAKIMRDAMADTGFAATRIQSKGIHYGTGRYTSSFDNLKRLAITSIGQAYNHARQFAANMKGAYGWYTVRGSLYPCSLCDSETGIFHPISESFLSYHPNCCCQQIFVYKDGSSIENSRKVYNSYGSDWDKAHFNDKNGGFNVYHKEHQFTKKGGEVEKIVGKLLADKNNKWVEFLAENGKGEQKPDIRFDGKTWDIKYIANANENTIRSYIKDARKADNAIFYWDGEVNQLSLTKNAVSRSIGYFKSKNNLKSMPNIYYMNEYGKLVSIWVK